MTNKQICKGNNNIQVSGNLTILEPGKNVVMDVPRINVNPTNHNSCISPNGIWLNGKKLPAPPKGNTRSVEIVNDHIWVSGYYWNGTEWIKMSKLRFKLMKKN